MHAPISEVAIVTSKQSGNFPSLVHSLPRFSRFSQAASSFQASIIHARNPGGRGGPTTCTMAAAQEALRGLARLNPAPQTGTRAPPCTSQNPAPRRGASTRGPPRRALHAKAVAAPSGSLVSRSAEGLERMCRRTEGEVAPSAAKLQQRPSAPVVRGLLGGGGSKEVGAPKPLRLAVAAPQCAHVGALHALSSRMRGAVQPSLGS